MLNIGVGIGSNRGIAVAPLIYILTLIIFKVIGRLQEGRN